MMKKSIFTLMAMLLITFHISAQGDAKLKALFNGNSNLVFLGLDFTQAKFIGVLGFTDAAAIKSQHIDSWNNLLVAEPKKFSLQPVFKLPEDQYVTSVEDIIKLNQGVDVAKNITNEAYSIDKAKVANSVSKYKLNKKSGIGLVYVVESLNKTTESMTAWVTFIDLATLKVLHTEPVVAKAGGFGFRNYWAGAVSNVNKAIKSTYYKQWLAAYK